MKNLYLITLFLFFLFGCKKEKLPPLAPSNLLAVAKSTSAIDLSWSDISNNESGFIIQRKTGSGAFLEVTRVSDNTTSYTDSLLQRNTTYTYKVYAYNSGGISTNGTNEASATTFDDPPISPSALSVIEASAKSLRLNWSDNSSNETSFIVERRLTASSFVSIATLPANSNSFLDTPLVTNTTYYYRVKAVDKNNNGNYSNEASGTPTYKINNLVWSKVVTGISIRVVPNSDSSILMLSRQSDVLKSNDNGLSWSNTNYHAGIANDYGSGYSTNGSGQWVFGTNGQGWLTTSDGGNTFSNNGPGGPGCGSFFVQGISGGSLIASKTGYLRGIYKSSGVDNSTWTNKYPGVDPRGIAVNQNGIFVAAAAGGAKIFLKSTDNGESWTSIPANSFTNDVTIIGDTLYWMDETSSLYKASINNLNNGVVIKNFGEAPNTMWPRLVFDASTAIMVAAAATKGVFLSKDKGQNWVNYTIPTVGYYYTATIIKGRVIVCTDMGVFVSDL